MLLAGQDIPASRPRHYFISIWSCYAEGRCQAKSMTRKRKVDAKSVEPKRSKRLSGAAVSKDAPSSKPISSATRSRQRPVASKEAEHNGARLTRLRARDLGKAPLQPDQEPERLLRQAHKAETTQEDKGKEADMELRPSAGAGPDQSVRMHCFGLAALWPPTGVTVHLIYFVQCVWCSKCPTACRTLQGGGPDDDDGARHG